MCGGHAVNASAEGLFLVRTPCGKSSFAVGKETVALHNRKEIVDFLTEEKFTVLRTGKRLRVFGRKNGDFVVGKETTDFRTEKETATLRTGKNLLFCRRRKMWLCGREGDGNFRTEKETVALRTTEETADLPMLGENMPALSQIRLIVFIE